MLIFLFACFPKQVTSSPVEAPTAWEASSRYSNVSLAMSDCRQKILNNYMYKQGLCETSTNQSKTIKKTVCSGTVSIRVVFKVESDTVFCRKV